MTYEEDVVSRSSVTTRTEVERKHMETRLGKIRSGAGEKDSTHLAPVDVEASNYSLYNILYDSPRATNCYANLASQAGPSIKLYEGKRSSAFEVSNEAIIFNADDKTCSIEYV